MATLLPDSFRIDLMVNQAEKTVVDALVRRLDDRWLVLPNFDLRWEGKDHEIDVVLLHPTYGLGIIEIKGGEIHLSNGAWKRSQRFETPDEQAKNNAYTLREYLDTAVPGLPRHVAWGVALPDCIRFDGMLPPSMQREQLLLGSEFDEPTRAIESLFSGASPLTSQQLTQVVEVLLPTARFTYDPQQVDRNLAKQIQDVCEAQVGALKEIDANRRIYVDGRAGTGKTYLATRWAHRGVFDGERVLLTCYNDPLGRQLAQEFERYGSSDEDDETSGEVLAGPFLRLALELPGMPPVDFPNTNDSEYWSVRVPAHLVANWHLVTARFDRIIVDEAQDFSPAWLGLLESLLAEEGEHRFFWLADRNQQLHDRGFTPPSVDAGWINLKLTVNVRNPRDIARLARRLEDGASAPSSMPVASVLRGVAISNTDEAITATRRLIEEVTAAGVPRTDILVVASDSVLRDRLRNELDLIPADAESPSQPACEVANRAKGLEYRVVIVVAGDEGFRAEPLYVAITRASSRLYVVAGAQLLAELGVESDPTT